MPGHGRNCETQPFGELCLHRQPMRGQRGKIARRPAQRQAQQARAQLSKTFQMRQQRCQPHGGLQAEACGGRLLHAGVRRHGRCAVRLSHAQQQPAKITQARFEKVCQLRQPQHQTGVGDVLTGRAPMDEGGMVRRYCLAQGRDQRRHGHAVLRSGRRQRCRVQRQVSCGRADRLRSFVRNEAAVPLRQRQRCLHLQHGRKGGSIAEQRRRFTILQQAGEERGIEGADGHGCP